MRGVFRETQPKMIGQNLNASGSRRVASALAARDAAAITALARRQIASGADALDLCAAGLADEAAALHWLVETVQNGTDLPLSLDSQNCAVLGHVLPFCRRPPLLNSYSGALTHPEEFRALCRDWPTYGVIVLCLDERGPQTTPDGRLEIARRLADELLSCGISSAALIFDPLTLPMTTHPEAQFITLETTERLRGLFPDSPVLCAVGNAGYGLTNRRSVERDYARAAQKAGANIFLCDLTRPSSFVRR